MDKENEEDQQKFISINIPVTSMEDEEKIWMTRPQGSEASTKLSFFPLKTDDKKDEN